MNRFTFELPCPPCVSLWLKGFKQLQVVTDSKGNILEVNILQFYLRLGSTHNYNREIYRIYRIW